VLDPEGNWFVILGLGTRAFFFFALGIVSLNNSHTELLPFSSKLLTGKEAKKVAVRSDDVVINRGFGLGWQPAHNNERPLTSCN
jgi:hypothetical protein